MEKCNIADYNRNGYDYVFNLQGNKVPPIKISIMLNDKPIQMELDTGSYYNIMSKNQYEKTWPDKSERPKLQLFDSPLKTYGGSSLSIYGSIKVKALAVNNNCSAIAEIIVVNDEGPNLLGRSLIDSLRLSELKINEINNINDSETKWVKEFPALFAPGLGCVKNQTFQIDINQDVPPKYCKARPIPYAMRDKVYTELDRLQKEGIITPVSHSLWAAPMVPVLKTDNSVRLCGDYKLTVNKAANRDTYPIPKIQDLFANLTDCKIFSKLDMSQAYAQLCLDDTSKKYTTINTPKGLFQYNRLAFGISSAPGIFQRAMENLFGDMAEVICYLDDILIIAKTKKEHNDILREVFLRLQETGIKLKWEKCFIEVSEVVYLGFKIDQDGLHPTNDKVRAIKSAPRPENISQLRSYLGLLNFYRKFIRSAANLLEPLNRLLKSSTKWVWGPEQEKSFLASKEALIKSEALIHFDPTKPIVVSADSSSYGLGAVLSHKIDGVERPVCFVSRTLSPAERKYPQVEREALALVYALRQFHFYLWGQPKFTLITDHKPLLGLFSDNKPISAMASGRIQRWALILQAYYYDLIHRSGKLLFTADALSRLPLPSGTDVTPVPADWTMLVKFLNYSPVTSVEIQKETSKDKVLSKVMKYCHNGWSPTSMKDSDFTPYVRRKDQLSLQGNCVLWGTRIIIPTKLRKLILQELHSSHAGICRMKELARSYVWWPNLDKDLEQLASSCPECLEKRPMPSKAELHPWEWPSVPWHRIHVDHAGPFQGNYYLIIVDAHSKWVDIYKTGGTTSAETIKCLSHSFATFGLPVSIVSDNGPAFSSQEFKLFSNNCGIKHITTAVYKPSTNGLAERMVQTFKQAMKSSKEPPQLAMDRFLFNYRLTPHTTTGVSPAELMFGRRLRSKMDLLWPTEGLSVRVSKKQETQKRYHTRRPREVQLKSEAPVMVRNYSKYGGRWAPANVRDQTGPVSYRCQLENGSLIKRHQDQIHSRAPQSLPPIVSPRSQPLPVPTVDDQEDSPLNVTDLMSEGNLHADISNQDCTSPLSTTTLRRSSRIRKPVERLNL